MSTQARGALRHEARDNAQQSTTLRAQVDDELAALGYGDARRGLGLTKTTLYLALFGAMLYLAHLRLTNSLILRVRLCQLLQP